jgi:hypothetical protein
MGTLGFGSLDPLSKVGLSFIPSFIFPERLLLTAATYIFTAPTCATTINTLEPYALNAEFQLFIPRFNKKKFLTLRMPVKEGIGGEREGDFTDYYITCPAKTLKNNQEGFMSPKVSTQYEE